VAHPLLYTLILRRMITIVIRRIIYMMRVLNYFFPLTPPHLIF